MKPKALAEAIQGSFEQVSDDIREALRALYPRDPATNRRPSVWVRATLPESVIYEQDDDRFFRRTWARGEDGTITFGDPEPVDVVEQVIPDRTPALTEAAVDFVGELVPVNLTEAAVAKDGTVLLKIINEGWGSKGYYSQPVLERDGAAGFPAGTIQFWDHMTEAERRDKPEGFLNRVAAKTIEDARWVADGPDGPGLYAKSKVVKHYREHVASLAEDGGLGVSINADGYGHMGEAAGRRGLIVDAINPAPLVEGKVHPQRSIDFVTAAGRGGKVLTRFKEAALPPGSTGAPPQEEDDMDEAQLREAIAAAVTPAVEAAVKPLQDTVNAQQQTIAELRESTQRRNEADQLVSNRSRVLSLMERVPMLPATKNRIADRLAPEVPLTEAGTVDETKLADLVKQAVSAEQKYLLEASGGRIHGMGSTGIFNDPKPATKETAAGVFKDLGLSEAAAAKSAGTLNLN